jgi:hypothetical protein
MLGRKATTTVTHISSLFPIPENKGIDKERFLKDAGIDPSTLESPGMENIGCRKRETG